jgi:tungstate transport system substrate-binding protein
VKRRNTSLKKICIILAVLTLILILLSACGNSTGGSVTLATTTSVENSGLLSFLIPEFEKNTGITLKVIPQGTGQAIKTGENGDADVLLVHSKSAEEKFVADGHGVERIELMYNYFVIVGPKNDPAGVLKANDKNAALALKRIKKSNCSFVSRGDESGTHKKELDLWKSEKIEPSGQWYISAGKGMGDVLSMTSEKQAYTLTDKATYLSMKDKLDLDVLLENADDLMNQYTIIEVNPQKHKDINNKGTKKFIEWMTSKKALAMIENYGKAEYGEGLFMVNYKK